MSSVIYFIQRQNGDIKVGTTKSLATRMSTLKGKHGELNLLGIIKGGSVREKLLHWCLSDMHVYKEWFALTPGIKDLIAEHTTIPAPRQRKSPVFTTDINKYVEFSEKHFSIKEVRTIMDWSYPTALKWAQKNGEFYETPGLSRGKWYIPFHIVESKVQNEERKVTEMKQRLEEIASNGL